MPYAAADPARKPMATLYGFAAGMPGAAKRITATAPSGGHMAVKPCAASWRCTKCRTCGALGVRGGSG